MKKTKKAKKQKVYIETTYTSPCAGIPHIGSKGWICNNKKHNDRAGEIDNICVMFRARYDPSDGSPKVPNGYVPLHLFFPPDFLSKRKIGVKRTAKLRLAFAAECKAKKDKLARDSKAAMSKLRKQMVELDEALAEDGIVSVNPS